MHAAPSGDDLDSIGAQVAVREGTTIVRSCTDWACVAVHRGHDVLDQPSWKLRRIQSNCFLVVAQSSAGEDA